MIIYRELSSLVTDLGFSAKTLYRVSNRVSAHYDHFRVPKRDGGFRELSIPDRLLKSIQRQINEKLLCTEPVSPFATAYRPGASTLLNALPHVGKPVILKLDIYQFFDHAFYPLVKEKAFPSTRYSERNRVLLALLCTYHDCLPQGAPSSPAISNLILYHFDMTVGSWCAHRHITFTRYCDDMTFSGDFDPEEVTLFVKAELQKIGFFLNSKKTRVLRPGQRQLVTGLVVNETVHVPKAYLRNLRQELFYCKKFGLHSHIERKGLTISPQKYGLQLLGKINYILSIDPEQQGLIEMQKWLRKEIEGLEN